MKRTSLNALRDEMIAVANGERPPSPRPAIAAMAALSSEAFDLMGVLLRERPANISELAALTGRAQPNVSRSLQRLAAIGLVRLTRDGREVRPEPLVRGLTIDLSTGRFEPVPIADAVSA